MVVDIAKIVLRAAADLRHAPAIQLAHRFEQRADRMLEDHQLLLEAVHGFDDGAVRLAGEHALLQFFEFRFERVEHREVAVHHRVHQRIQDEPGAVLEQMGFALAAGAHLLEAFFGTAAHREDEVLPGEYVDFPDIEIGSVRLDHMQHGEQRLAVFLDLGALMAELCVFDGKVVQAELVLQGFQFSRRRIVQRHPDEAFGAADVVVDIAWNDVRKFDAVLIGNATDQH